MKVVVIGANGFVGSHIVDVLARVADMQVVAFDRFSRDAIYNPADNVEQFKGDFFAQADVDGALQGADTLVHCFTQTNPGVSDKDPHLDVAMIDRSIEIFESCVKAGVKRVLFVSSGGAVYGEPTSDAPFAETDCPHPFSPYGIGKLAIENYLAYFKKKHGIDFISCRLTNPYGPRQVFKNGQGVLPLFADKIAKGETLSVFGDGEASRDYVYIEDAAHMMVNTMFGVSGQHKEEIYNVGSGQQTTLNEIIATLKEVMSVESVQVDYTPAPATAVTRSAVSMDRYWSEFGTYQLTPMAEGLRRMLNIGEGGRD